jgi:hypothetical protein
MGGSKREGQLGWQCPPRAPAVAAVCLIRQETSLVYDALMVAPCHVLPLAPALTSPRYK